MRGASLLAAMAASAVPSNADEPEEPWGFLAAEAFQHRIENKDQILVAFVAPQDELSSALLPQWKTLRESSDLAVAVNCTSIPGTCRDNNVSSLPAIRLYQSDGSMIRYRGPKRASDISLFIERMSRPAVTTLTDDNVADFSLIDEIVVMGQFHQGDVAVKSIFLDAANKFRDRYSFGMYELSSHDASSTPAQVICQNNLDDLEHSLEDFSHVASLERLLDSCSTPLVMPLNRRTELLFNKIAKSPVYYFSGSETDRQAYVDMVRPIAKMFKEYLVFATIDTKDYPHMPAMFGLAGNGLCLQVLQNGQVYHFADAEMSAATVQRFIEAVSGGEALPWDGQNQGQRLGRDEL